MPATQKTWARDVLILYWLIVGRWAVALSAHRRRQFRIAFSMSHMGFCPLKEWIPLYPFELLIVLLKCTHIKTIVSCRASRQWCHCRSNSKVYFKATSGMDPNTSTRRGSILSLIFPNRGLKKKTIKVSVEDIHASADGDELQNLTSW
jgi:hypothetical protein